MENTRQLVTCLFNSVGLGGGSVSMRPQRPVIFNVLRHEDDDDDGGGGHSSWWLCATIIVRYGDETNCLNWRPSRALSGA